jgi:hypothetical protein
MCTGKSWAGGFEIIRVGFILLLVLLAYSNSTAQVDVNKPSRTLPPSGLDPSISGRTIMDKLTPQLTLNNDQNTRVTILVGKFLTHKNEFIDQRKNDPAAYKTSFDAEQKALFEGLKSVLTDNQFKKLMGLKPLQYEPEDGISHLFY